MIDDQHIPGGLCLWTQSTGIIPFDGNQVGFGLSSNMPNGEVTSIAYEQKSQVNFYL